MHVKLKINADMNRNQINKSRMYFACDLVLDNHLTFIASLPELQATHQLLKNKLVLIEQYRQVQEVDSKGLTINKTKLRIELTQLIMQFSGVLKAYATIQKDDVLITKANYSLSKLQKSSDPILYDIGLLLFSLATPLKTELERFFLSQTEFDAMESLLNSFKTAIPGKRIATGTSKVSTAHIQETFKAIDKLLKEEMDIFMILFQFSEIDFYNEYKSARIIIDYTGRSASAPEELL